VGDRATPPPARHQRGPPDGQGPTQAFGIAVAVVGMMYARLRPGRCGRGSGVGSVAGASHAGYILLSGAIATRWARRRPPGPDTPEHGRCSGSTARRSPLCPLISARYADALRGVAKFSGLPLLLVLDVLLLEQRLPALDERGAGAEHVARRSPRRRPRTAGRSRRSSRCTRPSTSSGSRTASSFSSAGSSASPPAAAAPDSSRAPPPPNRLSVLRLTA
jgi:hypothetical protein